MTKFIQHIPYFEQVTGCQPTQLLEKRQLFYVIYKQGIQNFINDYHSVKWEDENYTDTLAEVGVTSQEQMKEAIPTANLKIVQAMLTQIIREERFTAGALATYASESLIANVLQRVKELIEEQ